MRLSPRVAVMLLVCAVPLAACADRFRANNPALTEAAAPPPPLPPRKPAPPPSFVSTVFEETQAFQTGSSNTIESQLLVAPAPTTSRAAVVSDQRAARPAGGRHRVAPGQTLYAVARLYGLPIRSLIDANGLTAPYYLRPGQELTVPQPKLHRVAVGETLYGISRLYDVQVSEVVRLNALKPPHTIVPGQQLILPGGGGLPRAIAAAETAAAPSASAQTVKTPPVQAAPTQTAQTNKALQPPKPAKKPVKSKAIPTPPARAGEKFLWPIEGKVIAAFGPREGGQHNDGINILAPRGAPVRAAENGVVAYAGNDLRGFGKLILIKHADGWITAYAHNDSLLVQRGDTVRRGQTISRVGTSGSVASPQLHFELRKGTRAVDPKKLLTTNSSA